MLKGQVGLLNFQLKHEKRSSAFYHLLSFSKDQYQNLEPFTEEERAHLQSLLNSEYAVNNHDLGDLIEEKVENEEREQQEFIENIREQYYDDHIAELTSVNEITRIIKDKVHPVYADGFKSIKEEHPKYQGGVKVSENPRLVKSVLLSTTILLNYKINEETEWAFRNLLRSFGPSQTEKLETNEKMKGKMLLGLKEYPRLNLKRAFWRWYLNSTGSGEELFLKAANNLVLYTNINKTTAFYRLLGTVRSRTKKVHPRVKRMTTMLYLYTRLFFDRTKRDAFDRIKVLGKSRKYHAVDKIVEAARKRKSSALKIWLTEAKRRRDEQNQKKGLYLECAKKLINASSGRAKNSFDLWRRMVQNERRVK